METTYNTPGYGNAPVSGHLRYKKGACCGPGWQATGLFYLSLLGVSLFLIFLIVLVANGGDLKNTSKATIAMHEETVQMKADVARKWKEFRANFPSNQEQVTTEQVLDIIDKGHAMVVWADQLRHKMPPQMVRDLVHNVTTALSFVNDALAPPGVLEGKKRSEETMRKHAMLKNVAGILQKGYDLVSTVTPEEFHDSLVAGHQLLANGVRLMEAVQTEKVERIFAKIDHILGAAESDKIVDHISRLSSNGVRLMEAVEVEKVKKIVTRVDHILSAAESDEIVDHIAKLAAGALKLIDRFTQPDGLRISLPIGPVAAVASKENGDTQK